MEDLSQQTAQTMLTRRTELADAVLALQLARQPQLAARYGDVERAKCLQDIGYHLDYLAEAVAADEPVLFSDYIQWARVLLANLGIAEADLAENLACLRDVLMDALPATQAAPVARCLDAARTALEQAPPHPTSHLSRDHPLADLAELYLHMLLQGRRRQASELILQAVEDGIPVKSLYLDVFERTQHEIGRLWQLNRISVAQEHYCTAATQLIIGQLYPHIFSTPRNGQTVVAACVGGELHELGIRMVADFFEMDGWDAYYLGANLPATAIIRALVERKAMVLALSSTMTFHVQAVKRVITAVRASKDCASVKILVGGYPFNLTSTLWQRVRADGYGGNALEAVQCAHALLAGEA